jgi:ABC-type phosphate transport system auxiliary subunit
MKIVDFPVLATARWALARDLDNLRFDVLSARSVADRLRHRNAARQLAEIVSAESLQCTLAHLDSILEFLAQVSDEMNALQSAEERKKS